MTWDALASEDAVQRTMQALAKNGITVVIVPDGAAARQHVLDLIPGGAEVMNVTSTTVDQIGLAKDLSEPGRYDPVRARIQALPQSEQRAAMRRLAASVDWVVGSVHAVTEDGQAVIASNSGSQLAPYAFSAAHVVWVVGTQKIVRDLDEAMRRVREHAFPLEDKRMQKAYGMPSGINKTLIVSKEVVPGRITLVFVREALGF
ncbi:MAG: lactate utilization protein [Candidatus Thermoplasmatota archaeon]